MKYDKRIGFYEDDAIKYGVNCAIFLGRIRYWVEENQIKGLNEREGRFWTYDSVDTLSQIYPYWSISTIKGIIRKLRDSGAIITDCFNESKWDKTTWYTLSDVESTDRFKTDQSSNGKRQLDGGKSANEEETLKDSLKDSLSLSSDDDMTTDLVLDLPKPETVEEKFVRLWNNLPPIISKMRDGLTQANKPRFKTRMKESHFSENWEEALLAIPDDDHCMGRTGGKWVATVSYFLGVEGVEKILERKHSRGFKTEAPKPKSFIEQKDDYLKKKRAKGMNNPLY